MAAESRLNFPLSPMCVNDRMGVLGPTAGDLEMYFTSYFPRRVSAQRL